MNLVVLYGARQETIKYYNFTFRELNNYEQYLRVHGRYILNTSKLGMTPMKMKRIMEAPEAYGDMSYYVFKTEEEARLAREKLLQYIIQRDYGD